MSHKFPHLSDSEFPDLSTVDVYKYANEFDYTRYDSIQMSMQLCTVPWDMGEAHIGNRTISGIGNVVYFKDKAERDKWFADIPDTKCYRFQTKFKELHRSNQIDVAIPFDVAAKYNYLVVDYNLFANDDSPVMYERQDGLRRWFWFVREVEFIAPNTTKLHLMNDAWQTFIYDLNVSGMMLERGHAPLAAMDAAAYLENPMRNCGNLLAMDVMNDNALSVGYAASELIFNEDDVKAVVITTANPYTGNFGTKLAGTWKTDAKRHFTQDGVPSYCAFAFDSSMVGAFVSTVSTDYPQFLQTIQGICFISGDMLNLGNAFTFAGVSCHLVSNGYKANDVIKLDKAAFGYPAKYADIAKLYTFPYAYIELSDENGDVTEIRIEQTNGKITFESCVNLVYPWLQISGHLTSNGRGSKRSISFKNISEKSLPIKGDWYKTIKSWDVPLFGVTQDAGEYNDFATDFDRAQMKINADTEKTNADANADTAVTIAGYQTTANTAITAANITKVNSDYSTDYTLTYENKNGTNAYVAGTVNNQILADNQRATIAANAAYNQAGVGAVTSVLSGNIMGAVGSIAGGSIEVGSIMATNSVTVNQAGSQATLQQTYNTRNADKAVSAEYDKSQNMITNVESIRDAQNTLTAASAAAAATTMKANATRTQSAAYDAIANQIAQAALGTPRKFGDFAAGETATVKPMGLFCNIITQDPYSIAYAGDEMLRYGYMLNKYWEFDGNWNVKHCKHYAYWKLSDFWVSNLDIPDMYVDKIRFFLFGGVTVWRKPEYIGKTDPYDNMDWSA